MIPIFLLLEFTFLIKEKYSTAMCYGHLDTSQNLYLKKSLVFDYDDEDGDGDGSYLFLTWDASNRK